MPYCPYLDLDVADAEMTVEHIVPYALGGSDDFVIPVSKRGNDLAGSGPDSEMVNSFFMEKERLFRNIPSTSGNTPKFRRKGKTTVEGLDVDITIDETPSGATASVRTSVRPESSPDGHPGCRVITSDEVKAREILKKIARRRRERGEGDVDVEAAIAGALRSDINPRMVQAQASIRIDAFERAFAKIALATGHFVLGERYSRSPDAGRLRNFMWEQDPMKRNDVGLLGTISSLPRQVEGMHRLFLHGQDHVLWVVAMGDILGFSAILFGNYEANILLSKGTMFPELPHLSGLVFVINPQSRTLTTHRFIDYLSRAAATVAAG